jgi:hypothetical protein
MPTFSSSPHIAENDPRLLSIGGKDQHRRTLARCEIRAIVTEARQEDRDHGHDKRLAGAAAADQPAFGSCFIGQFRATGALAKQRLFGLVHPQAKERRNKCEPCRPGPAVAKPRGKELWILRCLDQVQGRARLFGSLLAR